MLKHRLLYGGVFLGSFLGIVFWDLSRPERVATSLAVALLSLAALFEFFDMLRRGGRPAFTATGMIAAAALLLLQANVLPGLSNLRPEAFILSVVLVAIPLLRRRPEGANPLDGMLHTVFGLAAITIPTSYYLVLLRSPGPPDGLRLFLWTVIVIKSCDTGCYAFGMWLGRRKLSSLSPNKSWEGSIGGALVGISFGGAFAVLLLQEPAEAVPRYLVFAAILAVVGQLGDLVESAMKRGAGVKDSGRWLPGIGGVLDSIDSLIPAAPIVMLLQVAWPA